MFQSFVTVSALGALPRRRWRRLFGAEKRKSVQHHYSLFFINRAVWKIHLSIEWLCSLPFPAIRFVSIRRQLRSNYLQRLKGRKFIIRQRNEYQNSWFWFLEWIHARLEARHILRQSTVRGAGAFPRQEIRWSWSWRLVVGRHFIYVSERLIAIWWYNFKRIAWTCS